LGLGRFFSFLILYTVGRTPWTGNQPVARHLPIHRINAHYTDIMPRVGFEPRIPVFERGKTVYALDRAATLIGHQLLYLRENYLVQFLIYLHAYSTAEGQLNSRMTNNTFNNSTRFKPVLCLFMYLLSSPMANYKINTSEDGNKQTHRNKKAVIKFSKYKSASHY
jgi:hypothetical protein